MLMVMAVALPVASLAADESVCASVVIEVEQDATLERQAFDAYLRINNGYSNVRLEDVRVEINFVDATNHPVVATSDPNNTNALFFIRISEMKNIDDVSGYGTVEFKTSAEIHWLIVPSLGAGGLNPQGELYYVGGNLRYTIGGEENEMTLIPDRIFVRPMPALAVDYFIQRDVFGDDAMTETIVEPSIPFPLGLRISNNGHGSAPNVRMVSAQPRIVDNEQGLLIGFSILSTEVNGVPLANKSLNFNFGTIAPGDAGVALTMMECSMAGEFTEFDAQFTHADELGGQLTSLITDMNAHLLLQAVLVDLPGRDAVRDFLSQEDDYSGVFLYESDNIDHEVTNFSEVATLTFDRTEGQDQVYRFTVPGSVNPFYAKVEFTNVPDYEIKSVTRLSDGSLLPQYNAWFSQWRLDGLHAWDYSFNLFDMYGGGSYEVVMTDRAEEPNRAPILQFIGSKVVDAGERLGFIVSASDPDGTLPELSVSNLPIGATFTLLSNSALMAHGEFVWTAGVAQVGDYWVDFYASDGEFTDSETVAITVRGEGGEYPQWWLVRGVIDTNKAVHDYAAVNMGQVRNIASMALEELEALPGGAGFSLTFTNAFDYAAVNVGQLKALATNFYNRLSMDYPWSDATNAPNDFAIANVGQVKHLFSFDPTHDTDNDNMPDWWEQKYSGAPAFLDLDDPSDASEDPDLDGRPNWAEYQQAKDPTVAD